GGPPAEGLCAGAGMAGVSIDSRTVQPGELFIAIRGPRHDGHGFVAGALAGGAAAVVVAGGARGPGWWRANAGQNTRREFAENFLSSRTRSAGCTAWPHALARFGGR